jgi:hypothetical protein
MQREVAESLARHDYRLSLLNHPFLDVDWDRGVTRRQAAILLGQWWHPLHYFPVFLSRTIAALPHQPMQTAVSKILYQELGEGNPARAHERLFVETMTHEGFNEQDLTAAQPFAETRQLLAGYAEAPQYPLGALGFLYATETADLAMVSGIGKYVRRATGASNLPWVDVHVVQEPDHVNCAANTFDPILTPAEIREVVDHAGRMWQVWIGFFNRLNDEMLTRAIERQRGAAATAAPFEQR